MCSSPSQGHAIFFILFISQQYRNNGCHSLLPPYLHTPERKNTISLDESDVHKSKSIVGSPVWARLLALMFYSTSGNNVRRAARFLLSRNHFTTHHSPF